MHKLRLDDAISITPYMLSVSEGCAGTLRFSPTKRLEDATLVISCTFCYENLVSKVASSRRILCECWSTPHILRFASYVRGYRDSVFQTRLYLS